MKMRERKGSTALEMIGMQLGDVVEIGCGARVQIKASTSLAGLVLKCHRKREGAINCYLSHFKL